MTNRPGVKNLNPHSIVTCRHNYGAKFAIQYDFLFRISEVYGFFRANRHFSSELPPLDCLWIKVAMRFSKRETGKRATRARNGRIDLSSNHSLSERLRSSALVPSLPVKRWAFFLARSDACFNPVLPSQCRRTRLRCQGAGR